MFEINHVILVRHVFQVVPVSPNYYLLTAPELSFFEQVLIKVLPNLYMREIKNVRGVYYVLMAKWEGGGLMAFEWLPNLEN